VVRFHNLPVESGLRVEEVQPSSPAATAGLLRGDIIIEFARHPVAGIDHLHRWLAETEPGARSTVAILRGAEKLTLEVTPKTEP
jgi:S1-C subfamily serine protease